MTPTIQLQLLLATFAGWAGLHKSRANSYLIEENRILKERLESSGKLDFPHFRGHDRWRLSLL